MYFGFVVKSAGAPHAILRDRGQVSSGLLVHIDTEPSPTEAQVYFDDNQAPMAKTQDGVEFRLFCSIDDRHCWVAVPSNNPLNVTMQEFPEDTYYCDMAGVINTIHTLKIIFGRRSQTGDHKTDASVVMSPSHAKDLAVILLDNIQQYEAKFGEIPSLNKIGKVSIERSEDKGPLLN